MFIFFSVDIKLYLIIFHVGKPKFDPQLTTVINDWTKIVNKGGQVETFIPRSYLINFSWTSEMQRFRIWHLWKHTMMNRFFPVLQTKANCFLIESKQSGISFARWPTGNCTWTSVVLFINKWYFDTHWCQGNVFCWRLCGYRAIKDIEATP